VYNYSIDTAMTLVSNIEERIIMYIVNNLEVKTSTRGASGYEGCSFSPAWTQNEAVPFIAATSNPTEPELIALLPAKHRTALHLGHYADSREAAYVVAYYKANMREVILSLVNNGCVDIHFPSELYDLPVFISQAEAEFKVSECKAKKGIVRAKKENCAKTDDRPADSNFAVLSQNHDMISLQKRFGRDTCIQSRKTLTINEFELRFGLTA